MLKHFAAATLGFAVLFGAIGPAAADKGGHYWINKYDFPYVYPYTGQSTKYVARRSRNPSQAEHQARLRDRGGVAQFAARMVPLSALALN